MASHHIYTSRGWMYRRVDEVSGEINDEFKEGLRSFMQFAANQEMAREGGKISCPCSICVNEKFQKIETVWKHVYWKGFTPGYYIWLAHGEELRTMPSTSGVANTDDIAEENCNARGHLEGNISTRDQDRVVDMITDVFTDTLGETNTMDEPNEDAKRFYDMLEAASIPIYNGCKEGQSALSAATRFMSIKTEWNLSEDCVDAIADFAKDYMPSDNVAPESY